MWNPRPSLVSLFDAFLPNDAVEFVFGMKGKLLIVVGAQWRL